MRLPRRQVVEPVTEPVGAPIHPVTLTALDDEPSEGALRLEFSITRREVTEKTTWWGWILRPQPIQAGVAKIAIPYITQSGGGRQFITNPDILRRIDEGFKTFESNLITALDNIYDRTRAPQSSRADGPAPIRVTIDHAFVYALADKHEWRTSAFNPGDDISTLIFLPSEGKKARDQRLHGYCASMKERCLKGLIGGPR